MDVTITNHKTHFSTDLFKKPINTNLSTKFDSAIDHKFKINLIRCLVSRAWKICSTYGNFSKQMESLCNFLCSNDYPLNIVESTIGSTLNQIYITPQKLQTAKKRLFIVLSRLYPKLLTT